jgi:Holliday junction DNA helicase RuvA
VAPPPAQAQDSAPAAPAPGLPSKGLGVIASVRGTVLSRQPGEVVVEASGVGYRLSVSSETLSAVRGTGEQATLLTHLVLRDDGMHLYGFSTEAERELFLMLIGVQGVGPKVALAVLSGGAPRELLNAIASSDSARFQAVPGIGKRTAERIIVELREKVAGKAADDIVVRRTASDDPRTLAREGLLGLGFTPQEADRLLDQAAGETPEDLIAGALRAAR